MCKLCKESDICEHNRYKYICKECCGKGILGHGRQKSFLKTVKDLKYVVIGSRSQITDNR